MIGALTPVIENTIEEILSVYYSTIGASPYIFVARDMERYYNYFQYLYFLQCVLCLLQYNKRITQNLQQI